MPPEQDPIPQGQAPMPQPTPSQALPNVKKGLEVTPASDWFGIHRLGDVTDLTGDVRSTFFKVNGTFYMAGFRHDAMPILETSPRLVVGEDVMILAGHGNVIADAFTSNYGFEISYPVVAHNGDRAFDDKGQNLPDIDWAKLRRPDDWPKRGLDLDKYTDPAEKNYVALAAEITRRNPRWVILESCNQNSEDPRFGATPRVIDEMNLRPPEEKALTYVVMNEPGTFGFGASGTRPLSDESFGTSVVGTDKYNSPQLFVRQGNTWVDQGTCMITRINNGAYPWEKTEALSQLAIRQVGEREFAYRMGVLFQKGELDAQLAALETNPPLRRAFEEYKAYERSRDLERPGSPQRPANGIGPHTFAGFGDLLMDHARTIGTKDQFMSLTDPHYKSTPLTRLGHDEYRCFLEKGTAVDGRPVIDGTHLVRTGRALPDNAASCTTVQRGSDDRITPLPVTPGVSRNGTRTGAGKNPLDDAASRVPLPPPVPPIQHQPQL